LVTKDLENIKLIIATMQEDGCAAVKISHASSYFLECGDKLHNYLIEKEILTKYSELYKLITLWIAREGSWGQSLEATNTLKSQINEFLTVFK